MIQTRLILIEGPPGSGKSTTAQKLADEISRSGGACRLFLEWSDDNPITIGDDLHLERVVSTALAREAEMLEQWRRYVGGKLAEPLVTVMESRFWQTSVMLMYAAGYPLQSVLTYNQRVIEIVQELNPVLVYFAIDDLRAFIRHVVQSKNQEWQAARFPGSWIQHVVEAFEGQKWFVDHKLSGEEGLVAFLEDWSRVAQELYARVPFPKTVISNPHLDWDSSIRQIHNFLDLP